MTSAEYIPTSQPNPNTPPSLPSRYTAPQRVAALFLGVALATGCQSSSPETDITAAPAGIDAPVAVATTNPETVAPNEVVSDADTALFERLDTYTNIVEFDANTTTSERAAYAWWKTREYGLPVGNLDFGEEIVNGTDRGQTIIDNDKQNIKNIKKIHKKNTFDAQKVWSGSTIRDVFDGLEQFSSLYTHTSTFIGEEGELYFDEIHDFSLQDAHEGPETGTMSLMLFSDSNQINVSAQRVAYTINGEPHFAVQFRSIEFF